MNQVRKQWTIKQNLKFAKTWFQTKLLIKIKAASQTIARSRMLYLRQSRRHLNQLIAVETGSTMALKLKLVPSHGKKQKKFQVNILRFSSLTLQQIQTLIKKLSIGSPLKLFSLQKKHYFSKRKIVSNNLRTDICLKE